MAATTRLLAAASRTVADVTATPTGFRLSNATLTIATRHEEFNSPHVIGWLPGSDSQLRDEFVLYVAHLDGMGRGDAVDGDDIYNAAIDNGLGSAMLLTLAQTFTRIAESPKRSLIFLASTGEELGIVGTPYFVEHPTIPLENIVAAINIDGPSFLVNPVTRVLAMGASNSNLDGVVDASTTLLGLELEKAAAPLNYSDHYPFVNKGIPSL